jgi:hypothetical protein
MLLPALCLRKELRRGYAIVLRPGNFCAHRLGAKELFQVLITQNVLHQLKPLPVPVDTQTRTTRQPVSSLPQDAVTQGVES